MTLLITGGAGFLGAYLARHAVREGARVVVFDKYPDRGRIADVADRLTLVEGDAADFDALAQTIAAHGIESVAHFAFILGSPSPGQMLPYVQVQSVGAANVLEAARRASVRRVVLASSVAAYGAQIAEMLSEDLIGAPDDPYGATKVWAEALGRHYSKHLGLDVVSLRFGSTYGLGRAKRGSYSSGLLPVPQQTHYMARVENAVRGHAISMPNDDAVADFTYAADAALASWLALTAGEVPSRLYNVCSGQSRIGEFTDAMRKLLPDARIDADPDERPGNPHPPMDGSKLKRELGFQPRYSLQQGLADYIARVHAYDVHEAAQARHEQGKV